MGSGQWGWTRDEGDVFDGWERRQWTWKWTWTDVRNFFIHNFDAGLSNGDKTFMRIGLIILIAFSAIGVCVINLNKTSSTTSPQALPRPHQLHNQKIFNRECGAKNLCVILFFPRSGLCADSFRQEQLDSFTHSLQSIASQLSMSHLGKLWTQLGDQNELESGMDTLSASDSPIVFLGSFTKDKFWIKSLLDDDDIRTVPSWILRCVKGFQLDSVELKDFVLFSKYSRKRIVQHFS